MTSFLSSSFSSPSQGTLSPREEEVIIRHAREMKRNLDGNIFTSPLKAALVMGFGSAVFAAATKRDICKTAIKGALIGTIAAGSHRFWYVAGYTCGFCGGGSALIDIQEGR